MNPLHYKRLWLIHNKQRLKKHYTYSNGQVAKGRPVIKCWKEV